MSDEDKKAVKNTIVAFLDGPGGKRQLAYLKEGADRLFREAGKAETAERAFVLANRAEERLKVMEWLEAFGKS